MKRKGKHRLKKARHTISTSRSQNIRKGGGSGSKKYGRPSFKKRIFHDFYSEVVENQDEDFAILCKRYGYQSRFNNELLQVASGLRDSFEQYSQADKFLDKVVHQERVDLTKEIVFTIDGDDAKDFDDAVSLRKEGDCYHLGIHIADVSYFIKENSILDKEALRRGTSVYLIDKVIPMFPEAISNHLCSLLERQYRFTYSCFAEIDGKGEIKNYNFQRSIIKSLRRCTYREVEKVLKNKGSISPEIDKVLHLMNKLKTILRNRRVAMGSINFSTEEQHFCLDKERIKAIELKHFLESENLIEEFMLVANICAAQVLEKCGTGIYRVHDLPRTEKLYSFERMVARKGFKIPKVGTLNPLKEKGMNRYVVFLDGIEDPHLRNTLSFLLLISMSQAEYSTQNMGHYALSFKHYTHFTSPIRRYPDLVVHRLIRQYYDRLRRGEESEELFISEKKNKSGIKKKSLKKLNDELKKTARLSSENERKAVDAGREYSKLKSMRFLKQFSGKKIESVIIKVRENGMFVKNIDTGIEGFISLYDLDSDLLFDWQREVYQRKRETIYEMGIHLSVKLAHLNFKKLFIDFKPV